MWHKGRLAAFGLILLLAGCRGPLAIPDRPPTPSEPPVAGEPAGAGEPYRIVGEESLVMVQVFRAGPLARVAHNHVVASRSARGFARVTEAISGSSFELRLPVAEFTIDEPELRAPLGAEFPPEVPDSAREGTRRNMLSEAVLDAATHPEIVIRSERIERTPAGFDAWVRIELRDRVSRKQLPVRFEAKSGELIASTELALTHGELGLVPFSAMLGAIQVADELKVSVRLVARTERGAARAPRSQPSGSSQRSPSSFLSAGAS